MPYFKFSDFTAPATPSMSDEVVGLAGGYNVRWTWQKIADMFQTQIDTVDPLPGGTFAKVMYYTAANGWGASTKFVTNGEIVGIGLEVPNGGSQLEVMSIGTFDNLINAYIDDVGTTTKTLNYSKYGIFYVTDGGVPANIDSEINATNYSGWFAKSLVTQKDFIVDTLGGGAVKFGDISLIDGTLSLKSALRNPSMDTVSIENSVGKQLMYGYWREADGSIYNRLGRFIESKFDSVVNKHRTFIHVQGGDIDDNTGDSMPLFSVGNSNSITSTHKIFRIQKSNNKQPLAADIIIDILNSGYITMPNLPTSALGLPPRTIWNNGGVLNVT